MRMTPTEMARKLLIGAGVAGLKRDAAASSELLAATPLITGRGPPCFQATAGTIYVDTASGRRVDVAKPRRCRLGGNATRLDFLPFTMVPSNGDKPMRMPGYFLNQYTTASAMTIAIA